MKKPTKKEMKIIDLAVEGLHTDGGHHKQHYLEKILEAVTGLSLDEIRRQVGHESGVAA